MRFHRLWFMRLCAVAFAIVLSLVGLEITLRMKPEIFGIDLANETFSRYGTFPGAMYFNEPSTRMMFMWPDFETRAYFNGYFWDHATDSNGFRNPPSLPKKTILLGDSMIYGHGVESDETVSHYLRTEHGVDAYDMSRQGDCLYQHYVNLRLNFREFAPETVVLFVFFNDFADLETYRSSEEIVTRPEIADYDYASLRAQVDATGHQAPGRLARLANAPAIRRFFPAAGDALERGFDKIIAGPAQASPYPFDSILFDDVNLSRMTDYYDSILGDLADRAHDLGTNLVLVQLDIGWPDRETARDRVRSLLGAIAAEHQIAFFDAGRVLRDCNECFLENDGHFSPVGHRVLADYLAGSVLQGEPQLGTP